MNDVFDPQLEALAFDYVSCGIFTVVSNLWTWVALVTGAAFSFWRISRISVGKSEQQPPRLSSAICIDDLRDCGNQTQPRRPLVLETSQRDDHAASSSDTAASASSYSLSSSTPSVLEEDGVTKGKFVKYYRGDDDDKVSDGNCDELTVVGEWGESWDTTVLLKMRKERMGWYRCQDLTVITGNVVRLWDGLRGQQYNPGCAVW